MTNQHRTVTVARDSKGLMTATNARGGVLPMGSAVDGDTRFSPVELLLAAIAGCTAMDVAAITTKRAEPTHFEVVIDGNKIRDDFGGNRLVDLAVTFKIAFPEGSKGDAARQVLPKAVSQSHDRLCTVSRTVQLGGPIATTVENP